jgi:hypothetical protein
MVRVRIHRRRDEHVGVEENRFSGHRRRRGSRG